MGPVPSPAIDLTSRDYASIRQALIDAIPSRIPEWTSRSPQDFGIVLIELFATMGDILSYYTDRVANESFLSTATQRQSVLQLASMLNYRPRGTAAASTVLQFTVDATLGATIPAGTVVRSSTATGNAPIVFTTDTDLTVPVSSTGSLTTQATVTATQGSMVTENIGIIAGRANESFQLLNIPVVESSILVQVQESSLPALTWQFQPNLIDAGLNDSVYTTTQDNNGVVSVVFGDGLNGRIPARGATVSATYRVGGGNSGNVQVATLTEMASPPTGVQSVTNTVAATGGADAESIESIRANAPRALQTFSRAVVLDDFAALALLVPQVAKAKARANVYTNVALCIAPFGGGQPSARMLTDVSRFLAPRTLIGVDVVVSGPIYVPIDINVNITAMNTYSATAVQSDVIDALQTMLSFDVVQLGEQITLSDLYTIISSVPGVAYAQVTQLTRRPNAGVSDVFLADNEIPTAGTLNVSVLGGIVVGDPTIAGSGSATLPGPTSAPVVNQIRCDTSTVHFNIGWTPGANSSQWFVEIEQHAADGTLLGTTVYGPASNNALVLDLPRNNATYAYVLRTQAFNGSVGPVYSPTTTQINICRV